MASVEPEPASEEPLWRRFQAPQNQGRGFEKFVAAVQRIEGSGARVQWNERINGRQFDATVRQEVGDKTELTVFECRDYSKKPVGVSEVEAFLTKARDAGAHKVAIVTPGRFTRGAVRVAERHGVMLRTLKESLEEWPVRLAEERTLGLNIRNVEFWDPAGARFPPPGPEETVLPVTTMTDSQGLQLPFGEGCRRLLLPRVTGVRQYQRFDCRLRGFSVQFPREASREIGGLSCEAGMTPVIVVRRERPPVNVPHRRRYGYGQPDGEIRSFAESDLPLGADTVLTPGKFYLNTMGLTYRCVAVDGDQAKVTLLILEDLPGNLKAADIVGSASQFQRDCVEIEDPEECRKLEDLFRRIPRPDATTPAP